mmetsp:Transcript_58915/g.166155  ORF Transcript_58915/g.166155 Transcript_58915/m.166155 type:complete len:202 (+) Transcript_58915:603-1208(+)
MMKAPLRSMLPTSIGAWAPPWTHRTAAAMRFFRLMMRTSISTMLTRSLSFAVSSSSIMATELSLSHSSLGLVCCSSYSTWMISPSLPYMTFPVTPPSFLASSASSGFTELFTSSNLDSRASQSALLLLLAQSSAAFVTLFIASLSVGARFRCLSLLFSASSLRISSWRPSQCCVRLYLPTILPATSVSSLRFMSNACDGAS